jgi:hypothetical protein
LTLKELDGSVLLTQREHKKAKTSQEVFDMADSVRDVAVALREPDANGSPVRRTCAIQALGKETNLDVTQQVILARHIIKNTALADTYLASLDFPDMHKGVL